MIRHLFLFISGILFFTEPVFSQTYSISGSIADAGDNSTVIGATVMATHLPDSAIKGTTADIDGNFKIENLEPGSYLFKISYLGYNDYTKNIQLSAPLDLGKIKINQSSTRLKEVQIIEKLPAATQKGDTSQFNAGAYKTNPDASAEDLISKIGGVTVKDGKVQAQGEDVKQVLVDGKPFFGDDPNAVLKNLPAEVISSIQIFDKQSDQSQLTGFNDGNTSKTINIVTKPNMRNGIFGKFNAGYGENDLYRAGANINFFNGDRRFSILTLSNNINEQNFSSEDLVGALGSSGGGRRGGGRGHGGGRRPGGGGPDEDDFMVSQQNGITTTHAAGINYSDKWNSKSEISGSYFFNWSDNDARQQLYRQYITAGDSGLTYEESQINAGRNINHRLNIKFEYNIDSNNVIIFTPKASLQQNNGSSLLYGENNELSNIINSLQSTSKSKLSGSNINGTALYRHKFLKKGRTLTTSFNGEYKSNAGESSLSSEEIYFYDIVIADSTQQESILDKNGYTLGANIIYTEQITKSGLLQFSAGTSWATEESDKRTFNYSAIDEDFTNLDTSLSNMAESDYRVNKGGLSYRVMKQKLILMAGADFQNAELTSLQLYPYEAKVSRSFNNILPTAMIRYNISKTKSFRLFYRSAANPPSIDQLQDVLNNSNPVQLSRGNPMLRQDFQQRMFIRYSSTQVEKSTSFFAMLGGSYSNDYVASSTIIADSDTVIDGIFLSRGAQLKQPVNLDGYYSLRSFITYGIPLEKLKSNLNFNLMGAIVQTPGLVNHQLNYAKNPSFSAGVSLTSNISENIDFNISTTSSNNYSINTLNTQLNSTYFNQVSRIKFNWILRKAVTFNTDLTHQYDQGLSQNIDPSRYMLNAGIGYKFLKDKRAEVKVVGYDLLNQNLAVSRNVTETYTEDVQSNILRRYFMLTFTYNLRYFREDKTAN